MFLARGNAVCSGRPMSTTADDEDDKISMNFIISPVDRSTAVGLRLCHTSGYQPIQKLSKHVDNADSHLFSLISFWLKAQVLKHTIANGDKDQQGVIRAFADYSQTKNSKALNIYKC